MFDFAHMLRRNVRRGGLRVPLDKKGGILGIKCSLNLCAQHVVLLSESSDTVQLVIES